MKKEEESLAILFFFFFYLFIFLGGSSSELPTLRHSDFFLMQDGKDSSHQLRGIMNYGSLKSFV